MITELELKGLYNIIDTQRKTIQLADKEIARLNIRCVELMEKCIKSEEKH